MMSKTRGELLVLLEVAIIAAFAMALEYLPHKTGISSVQMSYGVIPVGVLALRRGVGAGLAAGFTWGILDLLLIGLGEGSVMNVTQGFLEYPVAFTVVGLIGLAQRPFQAALRGGKRGLALRWAWLGLLIGVVAKYLFHFYAGWIFWGAYAPKGTPAWLYSLWINGMSAVFTGVLALIVVTALITISKHLFLPKRQTRLAQS